ncbi:hypothetical protein FOC1_g10011118 [Fusarium oxysporum f. sp. cubense race 1]|uniref:CYC8-general repressor of transcription n=1 Tax=Fusarium oxysporum f. sp. cubense (strain race 1) TaxID=1229664 RepID=N4UEY0_FUSC1|nr:hypothetical protein FOC1_g10011118 [Fusarium oxysporum f. sp. cubense race 1]
MYSAGYGFSNNAAPSFNNPAPQQQSGAQPAAQQMMYNQQQQFAGMTPQGGFNPGANPQMMGAGPGGMNLHLRAIFDRIFHDAPASNAPVNSTSLFNDVWTACVAGFQQQFAGNPYGQVVPSPPSAAQGTPNNALPSQQGQFPTPQPPPQSQTPTNQQSQQPQSQQQQQTQQAPTQAQGQQQQQQPVSAGLSTPQTPTFSSNQGPAVNGTLTAAPLSPGTESRDKERFALLLDINHELLYESIQIQATQQELKKESAAAGNPADKKPTDEETQLQQDYLQCMRRLQANLSYMAALADRKPEVKVPPCPAYLTAPALTLSLKLRVPAVGPEGADNNIDPVADREERNNSIRDLYSRLQAVFPGIDPKREPAYRMNTQGGQKPGMMGSQASPTAQRTPKITNMGAPPMP